MNRQLPDISVAELKVFYRHFQRCFFAGAIGSNGFGFSFASLSKVWPLFEKLFDNVVIQFQLACPAGVEEQPGADAFDGNGQDDSLDILAGDFKWKGYPFG